MFFFLFFFFKQKTAYELRISDWSSDVCSSDLHLVPGIDAELNVLGSHVRLLLQSGIALRGSGSVEAPSQAAFLPDLAVPSSTPMMSDSFMISRSSPSSLTSVPDHLPNSTRSPALTSSAWILPASSRAPGPTASTSPSCGFSLAVSGMMIPPAVFWSASMRRTTTRSCRGRNFMTIPPYTQVETCVGRSEEHTSELQSLMRISYAVFCLKKKKHQYKT